MRPSNQAARDQLKAVLARRAAASAAEIAAPLGVSIPTLHRMLTALGGELVATGKARRTRYALRRDLRGELAPLPLYEIDRTGRAERIGALDLVRPQGSCLALAEHDWPVPDESRDGWWGGLPYPLYDMRPQGYMGRQFARAEHRQLGVSPNPQEWGDDDIAWVLARSGADASGNLILGDPAFERWQATKLAPAEPLRARSLGAGYALLADHAIGAGVAGSSAAGEFPKFAALRERAGSVTPHVLVKFSGAERSATVRRWADLLVCEHLALESIASLPGGVAAGSRIFEYAGRTFLEVERFDRHGMFGRSRLASLAVLDAALLGAGTSDWNALAERLRALGLLDADAVERIAHLWWFGRLIANTDMHTANIGFVPHGGLALAPAYDMLPMLYAPLPGGELPVRRFEPALPLPPQRATWLSACAAALSFWDRAAADDRISAAFRRTCAANARRLREVAELA
jgi:HipA-like C-terminal domain